MATLREWLNKLNFNWDTGEIVYQETDSNSPGWDFGDSIRPGKIIPETHEILDYEFSGGYGAPECPRFVAKDDRAVYFPWQYDGATGIERVYLDLEAYTGEEGEETPYPGG